MNSETLNSHIVRDFSEDLLEELGNPILIESDWACDYRDYLVSESVRNRVWENVPVDRTVLSTGGKLTLDALNLGFNKIEENIVDIGILGAGASVDVIVASPYRYCSDIRKWGQDIYDPTTLRSELLRGIFGRIWSADMYFHKAMPADVILIYSFPRRNVSWNGMYSKVIVSK
jgi:hypothetical protein